MRALVLLACVLALAHGQEDASSCDTRVAQVQQALEATQAQLAQSAIEAQRASAELEACQRKATEDVDFCKQEFQASQDGYKVLYENWQQKSNEVDSLKATIQELEEQLKKLEHKRKEPVRLDTPAIFTALAANAQDAALAAGQEARAIFEELQKGKTHRLSALLASWVSCFRGAASSAAAFLSREADEHLPEPVKKQIAQLAARAQALWQEHVARAAWAQPLLRQFESVNKEVKQVVSRTLKSHPSLAPLADPVAIQLIVYAVFALPLLLLVVLPLALLTSTGKKPQPGTRAAPKKKGASAAAGPKKKGTGTPARA